VGRIEILGNHKYGDSTVRRALLLDEGALFDWERLRRSLARVNRLGLFEPVNEQSLQVMPNRVTHRADVTLSLKEKPLGRWYLSGPVGPVRIAGPFQAVIASRLPAWGRGVIETSTYFASLSFTGFSSPLLHYLPFGPNQRFFLMAGLSRPYLPGQWWQSGFMLSPQLGWQGMLASYGASHLYQVGRTALRADAMAAPPLPVPVERISLEGQKTNAGFLICEEPKSHWSRLRTASTLILELALGNRPL
jgi:outer membrane protein insertion porin family